jgi:CubicO group peptidase (beta-lactamase class C family)
MREPAPAVLAGKLLRNGVLERWPGCQFVMRRDGELFADASIGWARAPWDDDGPVGMTGEAIIHVASMAKPITATALFALIDDWNAVWNALQGPPPTLTTTFPPELRVPNLPPAILFALSSTKAAKQVVSAVGEQLSPAWLAVFQAVVAANVSSGMAAPPGPTVTDVVRLGALDVSRPFLPLLQASLPAGTVVGAGVDSVTLQQLLVHRSGLRNGVPGVPTSIAQEVTPTGRAHFDVWAYLGLYLAQPADSVNDYRNDNYTILGAVVQALSRSTLTDFTRRRLLADPRFATIDRHPTDPTRACRYYDAPHTELWWPPGVYHPDYEEFGGAGGWYVSGSAFTDWMYVVASGTAIGGKPLVSDSARQALFGDTGYFGGGDIHDDLGPVRLYVKNGGTGVSGGSTNGFLGVAIGYDGRIDTLFLCYNASGGADSAFWGVVNELRFELGRRNGLAAAATPRAGLLFSSWSAGSPPTSEVVTPTAAPAGFHGTSLLPATVRAARSAAELRGFLNVQTAGTYRFRLWSDDGSKLWIDERLVIDNDGLHGTVPVESFALTLTGAGYRPIRLRWYDGGGDRRLLLEWWPPGATAFTAVPANLFFHALA